MANYRLTKKRIHAGIWEGELEALAGGEDTPQLELLHLGEKLRGLVLQPDPARQGAWLVRISVPPDRLSDGVQVFLITDASTGDTLGEFTIITGEPLEDDIRAEVALLRDELDLLKRAFRRHCIENEAG